MEFLVVSRLKQLVQFQMRRTGVKSGVGQFIILFRLRKPRRYTVRAEVRLLYGCWYHMEFPTLQKSRTCTYDVVVTYVLAKDSWRVRVPLGALFRRVSKLSFARGARGSRFESWVGHYAQLAQLAERVYSPSSFMVLQHSWLNAPACHAGDRGFEPHQNRFRHISKFISLWLLTRGHGFKSHSILLDRQLSLVERRTF